MLSNYNALLKFAEEGQYILPDDVELLKNWREDPANWGK
jgi:orotate phosphoribosyltransferase